MDAGLIVEEGPPDKLLISPKLDRTRAFIARIL
jgi:ABC-type histidine transport system ATPase subunit